MKTWDDLYAEASTPAQRRFVRRQQRHAARLDAWVALAKNPIRARAIVKRYGQYLRRGRVTAGSGYFGRALRRAAAAA